MALVGRWPWVNVFAGEKSSAMKSSPLQTGDPSRVSPRQRFTQRSLLPTAIVHASPFNVLTINLHVVCYTL